MQSLTLKSKQVFNYLFEKSRKDGIVLTPMKAIKLVYFCHAWYLGFKSNPLIDEPVEAWKYGAVVPSLYHTLKIYGSGAIRYPILKNQDNLYLDIYIKDDEKLSREKPITTDGITTGERELIDAVWDSFKDLDAAKLSGMMHQPGTPWTTTWDNGKCGHGAVIPNSLIEAYYKDQIEASRNKRQTDV